MVLVQSFCKPWQMHCVLHCHCRDTKVASNGNRKKGKSVRPKLEWCWSGQLFIQYNQAISTRRQTTESLTGVDRCKQSRDWRTIWVDAASGATAWQRSPNKALAAGRFWTNYSCAGVTASFVFAWLLDHVHHKYSSPPLMWLPLYSRRIPVKWSLMRSVYGLFLEGQS